MSNRYNLERHHDICKLHTAENEINEEATTRKKYNMNSDTKYDGPVTFNCNNMRELVGNIMDTSGRNETSAKNTQLMLQGLVESNECDTLLKQIMNITHDNDEYPQGKNIFMGSPNGRYKNVLITFQNGEWKETGIDQVLKTSIVEAQKALSQLVDLDHTDENTAKCIESLNDARNKMRLSFILMNNIRRFSLSKRNPDVKVIRGSELKSPVDVDDSDDETDDTESSEVIKPEKLEKPEKPKNLKKPETPKTPKKHTKSENIDMSNIKMGDGYAEYEQHLQEIRKLEYLEYLETRLSNIPKHTIVFCAALSDFDRLNYEDAYSEENSDNENSKNIENLETPEKPKLTGVPYFDNKEYYYVKIMRDADLLPDLSVPKAPKKLKNPIPTENDIKRK